MNLRRFLPYTIGLVILAFALGSLPRGSPGGSLLFQSTWLLYLIYLGPIALLGLMVGMMIFMVVNWKSMAEAIGFKIARGRATRKRRSRFALVVSLLMWTIAIWVLIEKPGTILNSQGTNSTRVVADITGKGGSPPNPFLGSYFFSIISGFVQNEWFSLAFLGILVVGGLVLIHGIRVSLRETSEMIIEDLRGRRLDGIQATHDAIRSIDDSTADARSRIITCFQHMMMAVSGLGVPISSDQTARELEIAIRSTFMLKGSATSDLTKLFEEARYSLHKISDEDAACAREYLLLIAEELEVPIDH